MRKKAKVAITENHRRAARTLNLFGADLKRYVDAESFNQNLAAVLAHQKSVAEGSAYIE
jgi:hypothetical protein